MEAQEAGTLQTLFDQSTEQEKQALAAQQMNEAFMEMGKALMPVLQTVTKIAEFAAQNVKLIGATIGLYGIINTLLLAQKIQKAAGNKEDIKSLLLGKSKLAQLAAQAVAFALSNPPAALLGLAIAGTVGVIAYNAIKKAGDINSPADGKTQISTKEGGLFELSPNDDIVAAPGASAALAGRNGGGMNSAKLEELQAQTNRLLKQVLNRPSPTPVIEMNDQQLGTAVNVGAFSVQ